MNQVTTGEVLIPEFAVNGKSSGSTIELPSRGGHALDRQFAFGYT